MADERKVRFYNAVSDVVAEYGLDAVTVKKIAANVGCSEALLYRYVPSIDVLMEETYEYACSLVIEKFDNLSVDALREVEDDPIAMFKVFWVQYVKSLVEIGNLANYMIVYIDAVYWRSEGMESIYEKLQTKSKVSDLLNKATDSLKRYGDNESMEHLFMFDVTHANIRRAVLTDREISDEMSDRLFDLIVNGIRFID